MKREGEIRIPSGCAISAVISREGRRMTGEAVMKSMIPMHDRSNGLGGGFAAYGIYPDYRDFYAFQIFFDDNATRRECEALLKEGFELVQAEQIPIHIIPEITDIPLIWRYFVSPLPSVLHRLQLDEKEFVARTWRDSNPEDHRAAGLCRPQNCRIKQKSPGGCRGSLSLSCICWLL